jgi:two-component system response regulator HydG
MKPFSVLIVDDEPDLRWVLKGLFTDCDCTVTECADAAAALRALPQALPDVIVSDMRMPGMSGLELLRAVRASNPDLPVVLLSAVEDIATAVSAVKEGAFDWQQKPFDPERLLLTVRRAAEQHALRREVAELRSGRAPAVDFGCGAVAQTLRADIALIAPQRSIAVLIAGESGTGKEIVARAIHRASPGADGPFVAVDCGALPEPLLESQLFGHVKGAFTGADRDRAGLFAMANGGTLFLDELGNLAPGLQQKLLRAIQERSVRPVGSGDVLPFDARILCATNVDLHKEVEAGRFRIDLYHRIAEFTLTLPPLRERRDDLEYFAQRFLLEANDELGRQIQGFTAAAVQLLQQQPWPGNLRELRNVVRRATLRCGGSELDVADFDFVPAVASAPGGLPPLPGGADLPLAERMRLCSDNLEARILTETLDACNGNKAAAARALHIDYTTMHRKLKRYGLGS